MPRIVNRLGIHRDNMFRSLQHMLEFVTNIRTSDVTDEIVMNVVDCMEQSPHTLAELPYESISRIFQKLGVINYEMIVEDGPRPRVRFENVETVGAIERLIDMPRITNNTQVRTAPDLSALNRLAQAAPPRPPRRNNSLRLGHSVYQEAFELSMGETETDSLVKKYQILDKLFEAKRTPQIIKQSLVNNISSIINTFLFEESTRHQSGLSPSLPVLYIDSNHITTQLLQEVLSELRGGDANDRYIDRLTFNFLYEIRDNQTAITLSPTLDPFTVRLSYANGRTLVIFIRFSNADSRLVLEQRLERFNSACKFYFHETVQRSFAAIVKFHFDGKIPLHNIDFNADRERVLEIARQNVTLNRSPSTVGAEISRASQIYNVAIDSPSLAGAPTRINFEYTYAPTTTSGRFSTTTGTTTMQSTAAAVTNTIDWDL